MLTSINSNVATKAITTTTSAAKPVEAAASATSAPVKTEMGKKAVPTTAQLNAKAFMQRQQIGAALYDRSLTLGEGLRAMTRQNAIATYAASIQTQPGGPSEKDLQKLDRKLDRAEVQITKLSNNARGADLDSLEAVDGRDLDIVQENLAKRIEAGLKDGSLTKDEGDLLLKRQQELNDVEVKFRDSDGKLTAGEQKQLLDQLRKTAAEINKARNNSVGVNVTEKSYSDGIDARQASLDKQLAAGIKSGALTEKEAEAVKAEFAKANKIEEELRADGRVDWKDSVKMSTALNDAEIALYDLQRNKQGVQLKDSYVDVKHADMREAQQLESLANGISNKALTDSESIELLESQKNIQSKEDSFVKSGGGLDRGEYLRLQSAMNDFSLRNSELQRNKDRWTGVISETSPTPTPVKPPVVAVEPPVKPPVVAVEPPVIVVAPPVKPPVAEVKPVVAAEVPVVSTPVAPKAETPAIDAEPAKEEAKEAAKPAAKREDIADRFGEFMTGMMKQVSDKANTLHQSFLEEARERSEKNVSAKAENDHHESPKADHRDNDKPVHADVFRSFDSYGKAKFAGERPNTGAWSKVA